MTNLPVYVLDANVFIQAQRHWYPFDIAPAFWEALIRHAGSGRLMSIDRVKDELDRGDDSIGDWAKDEFNNWFASTAEADVLQSYREVMEWVMEQDQFFDEAKAEFAGGADGWLVAYARYHGYTVVTHEQYNRDVKKRVPIPNVCQAFGVSYVDSFTMLRLLGVRFSLA